jgi:nitroimidazol reductase NimA-like FMN-containing flavoprotein (pyridoxamine 5'-phosphate oxidase superfamily)
MSEQCMNLITDIRRSDKAICNVGHIESILKEAPVGILSLCKDGTPYSIPVNFFYEDGTIVIHCAKEGRKITYVRENPHVCFLVLCEVDVEETECHGAMNYESVLCSGKAVFHETSTRDVLSKLSTKYGECSTITEDDCQKTALIVVDVDTVSGKRGYVTEGE